MTRYRHTRNRSLFIICGVLLLSSMVWFFVPRFSAKADGDAVSIWMTTTDGQNKLTPQNGIAFGPDSGSANVTIDVHDDQVLQPIDGFGAAMTDSSAWLIAKKMNTSQRNAVMSALFDPTNGIGVSFVRIPMGSSDFTATPPNQPSTYSYDDLPAGQTDPNLSNFSINHDNDYIIPTLQQARSLNSGLKFMANPWSPPAWMKTNGSMLGTANGQEGTLVSSAYGPFAQYFVKFIQAYQNQNIPIYAITPENEALYGPSSYSGMYLSAGDEATFIKNNLGPALANANLSTKILSYDHNWDNTDYANSINSDSGASPYVAGSAWHCYAGDPSAMTSVHNNHPDKEIYETECSTGATGIAGVSAIDLTLRSTQNWARTTELWNLALDTNGGPKMGVGCEQCTGLVTIDQGTGNYTFTDNYYQLGQVSKFVTAGAYHIASSPASQGNIESAAFKNADDSKVLVVHNNNSGNTSFKVRWNSSQSFTYTLPGGAIATFKWSGTVGGGGGGTPATGYAVNSGGNATGSFSADNYYSGGNTYTSGNAIDTSNVSNPAPQAVYQSERYGNFSYTFPNLTSGASYKVRLHFAETYWTSSGQRVFNVSINGSQVLNNFDIVAAAGGVNKAIVKEFDATANNGNITVQYSTVTDNAKASGIEIVDAGGGGGGGGGGTGGAAVNSGGSATGGFSADNYYSGGNTYATGSTISTSGVSSPAPQAVYQSERYGNFSYTFPNLTSGASYKVRLHFAELYWTVAGRRVFNVSINGSQVLNNFDIVAAASGANKAIVKEFNTTANNGNITVQFSTVTDNAKCSGIEVIAN